MCQSANKCESVPRRDGKIAPYFATRETLARDINLFSQKYDGKLAGPSSKCMTSKLRGEGSNLLDVLRNFADERKHANGTYVDNEALKSLFCLLEVRLEDWKYSLSLSPFSSTSYFSGSFSSLPFHSFMHVS